MTLFLHNANRLVNQQSERVNVVEGDALSLSSLLLARFSDGTGFTMAWIIALFIGLCTLMGWKRGEI